MRSDTMTISHQRAAPWEWSLAPRAATRLAAVDGTRWLLVTSGRVWLTQSGAGPYSDDVWLAAGEHYALPAGSEWVVEGWPEARVELLEAPVREYGAPPAVVPGLIPALWQRVSGSVQRAA